MASSKLSAIGQRMWYPRCSLLVVLAVLSHEVNGSPTECRGSLDDSCAATAVAEDVKLPPDETSLMHLTAMVKKGGPKRNSDEAGSEHAAEKARSPEVALPFPVFGSSLLQLEASEAVAKPAKGKGSSLLQLGTSKVTGGHKKDDTDYQKTANDYQKEYLDTLHMQYLHKDEFAQKDGKTKDLALLEDSSKAGSEMSSGESASFTLESQDSKAEVSTEGQTLTEATTTHVLAYVVLFGIVIVLLGLGLIVILGMKKEEDDDAQYKTMNEDTMSVEHKRAPEPLPAPAGAYSSPQASLLSSNPQPHVHSAHHPPSGPAYPSGPASPGQVQRGYGGGSPGYGSPLNTMQGNPITQTSHAISDQLCPEMKGAAVPENSKFPMKIPMLLHKIRDDQEHAILRTVQCRDGTPMFNLKITRRKPLPHETNHPEEYIRLSLPEEDSRELVLCAFGRPSGKLECHIYQNGKDPWGIIREDASSGSFTIYLKNSSPALQALVQGYGGDRRVRLVNTGQDVDICNAQANGADGQNGFYDVECYPGCDIILAIIMITGVDRMMANNGAK